MLKMVGPGGNCCAFAGLLSTVMKGMPSWMMPAPVSVLLAKSGWMGRLGLPSLMLETRALQVRNSVSKT
jgi:hypothetical protein